MSTGVEQAELDLTKFGGFATVGSPGSKALGLGWNYTLAFLGPQLAEGRSWGFSASPLHEPVPHNGSLCVYLHPSSSFCFLENPD